MQHFPVELGPQEVCMGGFFFFWGGDTFRKIKKFIKKIAKNALF